MRRLSPLLVVVIAAATVVRACVQPVYCGAPDRSSPSPLLGIAAPFGDDLKGSCDAFLSLQARSLVREGFAATGGIPLYNAEKAAPRDFFYYSHHPPGVAIVTSLVFRLFGESEGAARGVALFFSTITLLVVAAFVRREVGDAAALLAVVAMAALPIGMYWSTHLDYFVPTIAATGAFLALALRDEPTRRTTLLAAGALVVAMSFDSLALLAALAAGLDRLLASPRRWRPALGWPLLAAACAVAWALWTKFQIGRHGHDDGLDALSNVKAVWALHPQCTSSLTLLRQVERHLRSLVTPLGEAVLAAGLVLTLRPGPHGALDRFLRASALVALCAGLLPRLRAFDHVYFQLHWILPLGASVALIAAQFAPRVIEGTLVAAFFVGAGWFARPHSAFPADRPSLHRIGRELAAAAPNARAIVIPAKSFGDGYQPWVPVWYARRIVYRPPVDDVTLNDVAPTLLLFGLHEGDEVLKAKDARWPGRGGFEPLR